MANWVPLTCELCQKTFKNPLGLSGHMRSHRKKEQVEVRELPKMESKKDFTLYKQLPPPVVKHLEQTFGNWLNYMEVGQEYREDFGGYALYIKVPKEFSTEWKKATYDIYDNTTRTRIGTKEVEIADERWVTLKDTTEAIKYINKVKEHIITNAYRKGIRLPNTATGIDETKQTFEDYKQALN